MEDIIFDEYDEYELQKKEEMKTSKKHHYSRGFRKCALALALAVSVSTGFSAVPGRFDNMVTVEAAKKKDNKKPVIKLQGAASLQVAQNESVKIPKATAKDNVDGNLTKKIKVSVKCGKKSYVDLAKKIQKNKAVKFNKIGKYVITYTVSDRAKNKATKKRTVTVVAKAEEGKTTEVATTQSPTTQSQTTENKVTTEQVTTAATTTEATTTEASIKMPDMSKYGAVLEVEVNGNKYKFVDDVDHKLNDDAKCNENLKDSVEYENWMLTWLEFDPEKCNYYEKSNYLKFLGKITVVDEYGKDVSDNVYFRETRNTLEYVIDIYYVDSVGVIHFKGGFTITPYYSITSQMENYNFDYKNDDEGYGLHGICNKNTQN